jgi:CHASE2 domain-containing sensor protein
MTDGSRIGARGGKALFPRPVLLAGVVAILTTLLLADLMPRYTPGLLRFEHALADVRTAALSDQLPSQHPHLAIVGITDQTLSEYKTRLPIDRALLARLIDAIDAAGAKVIGIDMLFFRTAPADNEDMLIAAIKRAKAKVVLAAADERLGLSQPQIDRQLGFFAQTGRPAGYVNLAVERDWVVRFKAQPAPATAYPKSFAELLVEAAGYPAGAGLRRIAWLREPGDGSDTFLTIPAEALLGATDDPLTKAAHNGLKGKIVILGGLFPDMDQHLTPMTSRTHERMPGPVVHSHIVAEAIDGRGIRQLEVDSLVLRVGLAALAGFGFLIGWRYRLKRQGILLGSLATIVILAIDTIVFWQFRIILPIVLALLAWSLASSSASTRAGGSVRAAPAHRCGLRDEIQVGSSVSPRADCGLVATMAGLSPARADLHVIESTVADIKVGSQLADRDFITIPAGRQVRVGASLRQDTDRQGTVHRHGCRAGQGPAAQRGCASLAQGSPQDRRCDGSHARSHAQHRSRGAQAAHRLLLVGRAGDDRRQRLRRAGRAGCSSSAHRTPCGARRRHRCGQLRARRGAMGGRQRQRGLARQSGAAPRRHLPHPRGDRPRRQIVLRVLQKLPADDDVLTELHRLGCKQQFEAWVREKVAKK